MRNTKGAGPKTRTGRSISTETSKGRLDLGMSQADSLRLMRTLLIRARERGDVDPIVVWEPPSPDLRRLGVASTCRALPALSMEGHTVDPEAVKHFHRRGEGVGMFLIPGLPRAVVFNFPLSGETMVIS